MRAIRNGHQLGRDAQVIVGLANAALEHRFDPELSADSSHVSAAFLKFKRGRSSDHPELRDIGKGVEDLFRHAFAKIPLVALRAHVDKWQDGNGGTIAVLGGMTGQFRGNANSVAGEIKKPGENYDDGKADDDEHDQSRHDPFGQMERREGDFTDLKEDPTDDRVGCDHRVDATPLQFTGQLSPAKRSALFHFGHNKIRVATIR